jgi:hypothetical protein
MRNRLTLSLGVLACIGALGTQSHLGRIGETVPSLAKSQAVPGLALTEPVRIAIGRDSGSTHGLPSIARTPTGAWAVADADGSIFIAQRVASHVSIANRFRTTDSIALRVGTHFAGVDRDSIYVIHRNGRVLRATSSRLTSAVETNLPFRVLAGTRLRGGGFVLNILSSAPDFFGIPLVFLERLGMEARALGGEAPGVVEASRRRDFYVVAPSNDGGAWVCSQSTYDLDHWDSTATLRRSLRPSAPSVDSMRRLVAEGQAFVRALREDSLGRLWVVLVVRGSRGYAENSGAARLLTQTVVQVFDLRSEGLITSQRYDRLILGMPGDGEVAEFEVERGQRIVTVWRASINLR